MSITSGNSASFFVTLLRRRGAAMLFCYVRVKTVIYGSPSAYVHAPFESRTHVHTYVARNTAL
jgi:hypothetical protein